MGLRANQSQVRSIASQRSRKPAPQDDLHTVTAQLSLTGAALSRLLAVSGSQSEFVLTSADGSTSVRVDVSVSSVPDAQLVIGSRGVVLDWSRGTLTLGENRVSLSRMELRFLAALIECLPRAASRDHLVRRLWPSDVTKQVEREKALCVWIFALRKHFAALGIVDAIQTVRGVGYLLSL